MLFRSEAAAETRTFKEAMRSGGAFDGASRGYLEQVSLQLELEANRATIERVRKRMREFLLADIANEKAAEDANGVVLAAMQSLTERQDADAVVRVNAMLMIGELQGFDRKPFQAAAAVLARAAANDELPKSVRIAACVGLARHVEATKGLVEEQRRMAGIAQPAIVAILTETAAGASSVENDWLSSRCLTMLPLLGPATAETIAAAERIVRDGDRSINVRIRAAVALAAAAGSDSKLDAAAIIPAIGTLAVTSLERDVAIADRLVLERQAGSAAGLPGAIPPAAGPPGMPLDPAGQPAVEQLIPREVCRRAAWRLAVLAEGVPAIITGLGAPVQATPPTNATRQ